MKFWKLCSFLVLGAVLTFQLNPARAQAQSKVPVEVIIALRVGFDALQVLQNSPAVTNVVADRPAVSAR